MKFTVHNNTLIPEANAEAWLAKQENGSTVELKQLTREVIRSNEQNAKYWAWCGQVEKEQGYEAGYAHRWHKYQFGLAILSRKHPEYRDKLMAMLRKMDYEDRVASMDLITCTSQFNTSEMQEFMDTVQRHWAEQGIVLN